MESALVAAILLPLLLCLLSPFVKRGLGYASAAAMLVSFLLIGFEWLEYGQSEPILFSFPFIPSLGINFSFLVDGLSLFFGLLVSGMGAFVFFYSQQYMEREDRFLGRFYAYLNFFAFSMLGAVFADNLLIMFLFWELTGVASYLLVTYNFEDEQSILSGRLVFLITSLTGLALLAGILMIGVVDETFVWSEAVEAGALSKWQNLIIICFLIGIFGKSAQIPFHYWLPNAMTAPAPVSAYLHSATMVKLGIYLTARMYPVFVLSTLWFPLVTSVCFTTMVLGAFLSLISNDLKKILAYATVSQLGFFIGFYGIGDVEGVSYDFVHILNHALYKGSLFMLVGIIDHATGIRDIRYLGGLFKKIPAVALIFLVATAAMAGIPGTIGFISKELMIKEVLTNDHATSLLIVLGFASIFKVAFSIRLFTHLFIRKEQCKNLHVKRPNWKLLVSPALLGLFALYFGIWPSGLQFLADSFYVSGLHQMDSDPLLVWHGFTSELLISGSIFALGTVLFITAEKSQLWWAEHPIPDFASYWNSGCNNIVKWADKLTVFLTGRGERRHVALLFTIFSVAVSLALLSHSTPKFSLQLNFFVISIFVLTAASTLLVLVLKDLLSRVLALAASGFFVTLYFVIFHAPDLAMTQLLVEVVTAMMIILFITAAKGISTDKSRYFVRALLALLVGGSATLIALSIDNANPLTNIQEFFIENALTLAQGMNIVNVILVDFRGLDTLGEITVLLTVAIGILGLVRAKNGNKISLIPSVIFRSVMPYIFVLVNLFAIYLLFRGHNAPGGGFIAGIASSITLILLATVVQLQMIQKFMPCKLIAFLILGLSAALTAALLPLLAGRTFLTHGTLLLPTTLIFDIGVFLVVFGTATTGIFALRADALYSAEDHE